MNLLLLILALVITYTGYIALRTLWAGA